MTADPFAAPDCARHRDDAPCTDGVSACLCDREQGHYGPHTCCDCGRTWVAP